MEPKPPYIIISDHKWTDKEVLDIAFGSDNYYYSKDERYFYTYYLNQVVCDECGDFFQIVGMDCYVSLPRRVFSFLPNVYKRKIKYKKIKPQYSFSQLKQYYIQQLDEIGDEPYIKEWKQNIQAAMTYKDLLNV